MNIAMFITILIFLSAILILLIKTKEIIEKNIIRISEEINKNAEKIDIVSENLVIVKKDLIKFLNIDEENKNYLPDEIKLINNDFFKVEEIEFKKLDLTSNSMLDSKNLKNFLINEGGKIGVLANTINNMRGVFTATVNPEKLMKFADGTFGSAVMGPSGITGQAGFAPVNAVKAFSPMVVMQVLSMIVGQYYMQGITKQLNLINEKLDTLIHLHHNEKISILQANYKILSSLSKAENFFGEDITEIRNIYRNSKSIYQEYGNLISQSKTENLYDDRWHTLMTSTQIESLGKNYRESNLDTNIAIVLLANRVMYAAKLMEIRANVNISKTEKQRNYKIKELVSEGINLAEECQIIDSKVANVLDKYITSAKKIKENAILNSKSLDETVDKFIDKNKCFKEELNILKTDIIDTTKKLQDKFEKPLKTYLIVDEFNNTIPIVINEDNE